MDKALTQQQLAALLDQWVDSEVTIRVVSEGDDLIAVFRGRLNVRTEDKQPALFWPLQASDQSHHFEQPGYISIPSASTRPWRVRGTLSWSCDRPK